MPEVVEYTSAPGLGATYRRAALGLVGRRSGDTLPETTLVLRDTTIDRAHLAAYNAVCGFRLTDTLPATYPHVLAFPLAMTLMSGNEFPFRVIGLVHVANTIEQLRPVTADEHLELTVRAADLRPHDRGQQFDVRATASVGDEVVWRGVSTYLRRTGASSSEGAVREPVEPPPASAVWRVERSVGPAYAKVSGDRNPIHTSRLGARAFGFKAPIAHGMWTKAHCLAALEGRLPDRYTVDVTFKLPVALPAIVNFSGVPAAHGWQLALHDARTGRPHLSGTVHD